MYLIKNQSGSPDLKEFLGYIDYALKTYINDFNKENRPEIELPSFTIDIVGVPMETNVVDELSQIEEITRLTLKFFPLNGDTDYSEPLRIIRDLSTNLGSKKEILDMNNPTNIEAVGDLLNQSKGTVDCSMTVRYPNNEKTSKIDNETLSEKIRVDVDESGIQSEKNIKAIKHEMKSSKTFYEMKGSHNTIFNKFKDKVLKFFNKK